MTAEVSRQPLHQREPSLPSPRSAAAMVWTLLALIVIAGFLVSVAIGRHPALKPATPNAVPPGAVLPPIH